MKDKTGISLLKPEIIHSLSGLKLLAKSIASGYAHGLHNSRRKGVGMEFSQFRSYERGDDLRLLDWKMLARSGKYFIKESEIETQVKVQFVLDASNSMLHSENKISKLDYAKVLIASLAYIFDKQGDHIGLIGLNDLNLLQTPSKQQKNQWDHIVKNLIDLKPGGKWPVDRSWTEKMHQRKHKELFICITDGYQENEELIDFFYYLKNPKNEVMVIQMMGEQELNFGYQGQIIFEDLETGKRKKVDTQSGKEIYLKALQQGTEDIKSKLQSKGIQHFICNFSKPLQEILFELIQLRNRMH